MILKEKENIFLNVQISDGYPWKYFKTFAFCSGGVGGGAAKNFFTCSLIY